MLRRRSTPRIKTRYAPNRNGRPDPGEVCWAWVPFEDDPSQGKDRPVLVIATSGDSVIALPMTSKDHDVDAHRQAEAGRYWMDVGTGSWDREGRPSEVRLNRAMVLHVNAVRREGGALPRDVFDAVIDAATPYLPEPGSGAQA